jgi:hypothetical protein
LHGFVFAIFTASGAPRRRCFAPRQSDSTSNRDAPIHDRATNLGMVGQKDYTSKEFSEKPARKASAPGLYGEVYSKLFDSLQDHPQKTSSELPARRVADRVLLLDLS